MKNGIVIVNKAAGMTSQTVVNRVKRLFSAEKAGHTGTLDPMATGVLPVLIGRAVKVSEFMLSSKKAYRAVLRLGVTTDTEDMTGNLLSTSPVTVSESEVKEAASRFVGEIMQVPPMYSALKRDGHKLVDLARRGVTVEREARAVTVYSLLVERLSDEEYALTVECSKGTYIRTLCADIGAALGCGGAMQSLARIKAAGFSIDEALTLDALSDMSEAERDASVIDTEALFLDKPRLTLPPFFLRLLKNGCEIYQKKIGTDYEMGSMLRLYDENGFFALGEVQAFENGSAVKMIKLLREEK